MTNTISGVTFRRQTMQAHEFYNLPEVYCQRDTQQRVKGVAHLLNTNPNPMHAFVELVEWPNSTLQVLNGNTRALAWRYELATPPHEVHATIFQVNSEEEVLKLYQAIDSDKAVEKSAHKFQSAFKIADIWPTSYYIAKGRWSKSLQMAIQAMGGRYKTDINSVAQSMQVYKDEIQDMDLQIQYAKYMHDELRASEEEYKWTVHKFGAVLMAKKKWGATNSRLNDGINAWLTGNLNWVSNDMHSNAIEYMVKTLPMDSNLSIYFNTTNPYAMEAALDIYLDLLDRWMLKKPVRKLHPKRGYYRDYFKTN